MRTILLVLLLTTSVHAGGIYSYVNEQGVKVYTNSPPHRKHVAQSDEPRVKSLEKRSQPFKELIQDAAQRHDVDERLIEAVIAVESNFNPQAVSSKDCKGLMQLHPDTAKRFGVEDVFDPAQNIEGGVKYLRYLIDYFEDDLTYALAAYNAGENAVDRYKGVPPYRETRQYVKKIGNIYDFSQWDLAKNVEVHALPDKNAASRRVVKVSLPDGRVVYTNTPSLYGN